MLDINSPLGQESLQQEMKMLKYVSKCWDIKIRITKKETPAPYDGIMLKNNIIIGIFESKNRIMSLESLEDFGSWLITFEKLEKCRIIANKMNVPFYGFLGLELSKLIMYWKISDENGNYLFDFKHFHSATQATINGGEAYRDNAYLPIEFGNFVQINQKIF